MARASSSRISLLLAAVAVVSTVRASVAAAEPQASDGVTAPAAAHPPEGPPAPAELSQLPRTQPAWNDEPRGPFPSRPPTDPARTLSAAVSLGPGWLALRDEEGRDGQRAIGFALRLGAVVAPEWNLFLAVERNSTQRGGATFAQTAALGGVQRFFFGRLYLGGALALAMVQESGVPGGLTDGPGYGFSTHVGVELFRVQDAALTAELTLTMAKYPHETWEMGGLRLGLVIF
jgi:hypothetical protein